MSLKKMGLLISSTRFVFILLVLPLLEAVGAPRQQDFDRFNYGARLRNIGDAPSCLFSVPPKTGVVLEWEDEIQAHEAEIDRNSFDKAVSELKKKDESERKFPKALQAFIDKKSCEQAGAKRYKSSRRVYCEFEDHSFINMAALEKDAKARKSLEAFLKGATKRIPFVPETCGTKDRAGFVGITVCIQEKAAKGSYPVLRLQYGDQDIPERHYFDIKPIDRDDVLEIIDNKYREYTHAVTRDNKRRVTKINFGPDIPVHFGANTNLSGVTLTPFKKR